MCHVDPDHHCALELYANVSWHVVATAEFEIHFEGEVGEELIVCTDELFAYNANIGDPVLDITEVLDQIVESLVRLWKSD
jgi:hypothetical protein